MQSKKKSNKPPLGECCKVWLRCINGIEVVPRLFYDPKEKHIADMLADCMKHFLQNYCPTCGHKLVK